MALSPPTRKQRCRYVSPLWLGILLSGSVADAHAEPPQGGDQVEIARQLRFDAEARARRPSSTPDSHALPPQSAEGCILPQIRSEPVHRETKLPEHAALGWALSLEYPELVDHQPRMPPRPDVVEFGNSVHVGERFTFDVTYSGNPAGFAEVYVAAREPKLPDSPYPGGPVYRVEGSVSSSGVLSLLATVNDHMTSWMDARTGAPLRTKNVLDQQGLGVKYKHRETITNYQGRGYVRIHDAKDGKVRKRTKNLPADTFDPISGIAWVRALDLAVGETATAHALDGAVLLRLEVTNRGPTKLDPLPSVASGLGVTQSDIVLYEGRLSRVDRFDEAIPGKRSYHFRAWVAQRSPKLLLALESDMWIGVVRITLSRYDPPNAVAAPPATRNPTRTAQRKPESNSQEARVARQSAQAATPR